VLDFNPMTTVYAVVSAELGIVSLWSNFGDAEAAAGELSAMDPEDSYHVEEEPVQPGVPHFDYTNCNEVPF
jgi:hypothetical protein